MDGGTLAPGQKTLGEGVAKILCNLLRPLIKMFFVLVPYSYILLKRIPKEMTVLGPEGIKE